MVAVIDTRRNSTTRLDRPGWGDPLFGRVVSERSQVHLIAYDSIAPRGTKPPQSQLL